MRAWRIDFLPSRRQPALGWGWLFLGALALGAALAAMRHADRQVQAQATQADAAQRRDNQRARALRPAPAYTSDKRWQAAARSLSLPWDEALSAIERATLAPVHLLSLSPDSARGVLRLEVEVGQYGDALDYLARLGREGSLGQPLLQSHELVQDPNGRSYLRAVLSVPWKH